jgi:hypothetical protein
MNKHSILATATAVGVTVAAVQAIAQDPPINPTMNPMVAAAKNYRLEFENDSVKVIHAAYGSREKVPVHQHPTFPTVYVYLTDSGPMRFTHITPSYTVERRPVSAGGVRFNRNAHIETHVVENLSDMPNEYLRIELKTVPDSPHPDARLSPDDQQGFEDAQVRISRHVCAAGAVCDAPKRPAVLVSLNDKTTSWFEPGSGPRKNALGVPIHQLWVELKTRPVK